MDRVTLEHYEQRARKGRELVDRIDSLVRQTEMLKQTYGIRFETIPGYALSVGTWDRKVIEDNFEAELVANVVKVAIDLKLKRIRELEQELAEL